MSRRFSSFAVSVSAELVEGWRIGCPKTLETSVEPRWICLAKEKRGEEVQLLR